MSQSDFGTIDPNSKSGPQLALDLNKFRDALNSGHRGSARPAYAQAGMQWVRETSSTQWDLMLFDGDTDFVLRSINPATNQLIKIQASEISGLGSASAATLTTTTTDNTVGRALKVGDFGIGAIATAPQITDFKTSVGGGIYKGVFNTTANGPVSTTDGFTAIATNYVSSVVVWLVISVNRAFIGYYNAANSSISWVEQFGHGNVTPFAQTLLAAPSAGSAKTILGVVDGIGISQAWQDVTSSRVLGTTYTNTTGKPIAVSGYVNNASGGRISCSVSGLVLSNYAAASGAPPMPFSFIVPPGATYSISLTAGTGTLAVWTELR